MAVNYNKKTFNFSLAFKYIGQEEFLDERGFDWGIRLLLGIKSRRINQILVHLGKGEGAIRNHQDLAAAIGSAIDSLEKGQNSPVKSFNYFIVKEIMSSMSSDIFGVVNRPS